MKTPPMLIGAALLFWGWQADFLVVSAVLAAVLEGSRFIKLRWELTNEDFSRLWVFCTLLLLASAAYAFTSSNGPANFRELFSDSNFSPEHTVGATGTKTAVLLIRWLPLVFFLFIAAQAFSSQQGVPLEVISLILRRRWKKLQKSGKPMPPVRVVNMTYPYFLLCLFAATTHPSQMGNDSFFACLCGLSIWALWPLRSRRFNLAIWAGAMGMALLMAYGGVHGLVRLQRVVSQYNPQWLADWLAQGLDPFENRTQIGQIGRIETSRRIVIRLQTTNNLAPPEYLREAAYQLYNSSVWYSGSTKSDFAPVAEDPFGSGTFTLLPGQRNPRTVKIACYLPGGRSLLPLPGDTGTIEHLQAYLLQKNAMGSLFATGPGLVIYDAFYGSGTSMESPPDTNEDLRVPDKEKPALAQIISDLHLEGMSRRKALESIGHYFGTQFKYSLWQQQPKRKDTNVTDVTRFLITTHKGHCEYFATATVLLLRELNIPARYAVGYAVHEPSGSGYVVRESDAHAWCRVWDQERNRWEDFDTTPGIWFAMEREQRSSLQFFYDAWSRVVFEFSKFRWGQGRFREYLPWVLVPVLVLLLYQIIFRSARRRARLKSASSFEDVIRLGQDSEFYKLEGELARRGYIRQPGETLTTWLQHVSEEPALSALKEPLGEILRLHYRYRFDPQGLSAEQRELLSRKATTCLAALRAKEKETHTTNVV